MPGGSLIHAMMIRHRRVVLNCFVVGVVGLWILGGLSEQSPVLAQNSRAARKSTLSKIFGRVKLGHSTGEQSRPHASSRYLATARQLLSESRKLAAEGKIDAAIQLAERADTLTRVASRTTPAKWPAYEQTPGAFLAELRTFQAQQSPALPVARSESLEPTARKPFQPLVLDENPAKEPKSPTAGTIAKKPLPTQEADSADGRGKSPYQLLPFEVAAPDSKRTLDGQFENNPIVPIPPFGDSDESVLPFVDSTPNVPNTIVTEPPAWRPLDEQPIVDSTESPVVIDNSIGIEPIPESDFLAAPIAGTAAPSNDATTDATGLVAASGLSQNAANKDGSQPASIDKASLWTMALIQTISTFAGLLLGLIVFVVARFFILKRYGERLGWVLRVEHVNGNSAATSSAADSAQQITEEDNESHGASFEDAPFPFRVVGTTYADEKEAAEQREREREQALLKHVFEQNLELQNQLADLEESAA